MPGVRPSPHSPVTPGRNGGPRVCCACGTGPSWPLYSLDGGAPTLLHLLGVSPTWGPLRTAAPPLPGSGSPSWAGHRGPQGRAFAGNLGE